MVVCPEDRVRRDAEKIRCNATRASASEGERDQKTGLVQGSLDSLVDPTTAVAGLHSLQRIITRVERRLVSPVSSCRLQRNTYRWGNCPGSKRVSTKLYIGMPRPHVKHFPNFVGTSVGVENRLPPW
jgi:hypothetical protein